MLRSRISLGIAGCLQYNDDKESSSFLYIAVAAGLLLIIVLLCITVKYSKRRTQLRSSSAQRSVADSERSPNAAADSLPVESATEMTGVDADEGGYTRHLSVASDYSDCLAPSHPPFHFL